jgi:hypothetical protein
MQSEARIIAETNVLIAPLWARVRPQGKSGFEKRIQLLGVARTKSVEELAFDIHSADNAAARGVQNRDDDFGKRAAERRKLTQILANISPLCGRELRESRRAGTVVSKERDKLGVDIENADRAIGTEVADRFGKAAGLFFARGCGGNDLADVSSGISHDCNSSRSPAAGGRGEGAGRESAPRER